MPMQQEAASPSPAPRAAGGGGLRACLGGLIAAAAARRGGGRPGADRLTGPEGRGDRLGEDQAESFRALAEEALMSEVRGVQERFAETLRAFEAGGLLGKSGKAGAAEEQGQDAADRQVERLQRQVMKMEQKRRRRRLEATALRQALKEVRSTMVGVNTTREEEGEVAAEQLLNEIRSEREDWREEKRRLREQIQRLEEELQAFTPSVDPEKENLRRSVKQLQNSIISRDQFSCWVCQQHLVRKHRKETDSVDDQEEKVEDSDDEDEVTEIKRQISLRRADLRRLLQRKVKRSASLSSSSDAGNQSISPCPWPPANQMVAPHSGFMPSARGRVPLPHVPAQTAEGDATTARQHVRWMEAEAADTLEVVVDHPVRTSRNRVATPFVPWEVPLHGNHQLAAPSPSAKEDSDASAEEATPAANNIQFRATRDRVATPFAPPVALAPEVGAAGERGSVTPANVPDLTPATSCGEWHSSVHFNDVVSVEDASSLGVALPMRSSRGRICTPFVSVQDVVTAAMEGEAAGRRRSVQSNSSASPVESGRVATPPLAHEHVTTLAAGSRVGDERLPLVRFDDRANISDLSPQAGTPEMRSSRSRVATPFSTHLDTSDGVQHNSIQFSDEVSVASPTVEGGNVPLRSSRERIATPFVTSLDYSSAAGTAATLAATDAVEDEEVRFMSDDFKIVVKACSDGDTATRSIRGRMATPFISLADAEYKPEAPGRPTELLVQFSDDVSTASPCPGGMSPTERPIRMTRARASTPFNFEDGSEASADLRSEGEQALSVQFSEAVSVTEASATDESASPLRSSRGRLATPFVSLADAEGAPLVRMGQSGMDDVPSSIHFSEDVSTTETSPLHLPVGMPIRSTRGRVATPFVSKEMEEDIAFARASTQKRPSAVEFSGDVSVGYACAGPMRSTRGRRATPFVSWENAAGVGASSAGASGSSGVQFAEDARLGAGRSSQLCIPRPRRSCRGRVATPFCSSQDAGDLEVAMGRRVQFRDTVNSVEAAAGGLGAPARSIRGRLATPFFNGPIEDTTIPGRTVQFAESHAADVFVIPPVGEMRPVRRRRDSSSSSTGSDSRGRGNFRSPGPGAGRGRGRSPRTRRTLLSASEPLTVVKFAAGHEEVEAASFSAGKRARAVRERQPTGFVREGLAAAEDFSLPNSGLERNSFVRAGFEDFQPRPRFQTAGDPQRLGVEGPHLGNGNNTVRFVDSPMIFDGIRLGEEVRSVRGRTPTGFLHETAFEMMAAAPRQSAHFAEVASVFEAASQAAPEECLRSLRTRIPTGFVAGDVFAEAHGVRFAEEASVHEAFITGELRPLRGRAPTGYSYPEELGCSSEAGTTTVRFAPGVTDTIHSRPAGRARVPTGAAHADDLPQDECRSGGSGSSTRTPSVSVREDRASVSEDNTDLEGDNLRAHLGIRFASAASVEEAPISPFLQELRPVRSRVPTGYLTEGDVAEMTLDEAGAAVSFLEADVSPLLISSEMKSSRSRTPTGWDGSILPLEDHRVRFTEASMRQGGGEANKYHRAESDASSVSSRSGSTRRGGRSATEAPADTEEGISDSETQSSCSSRNPRSRMTTPYMNSTNLGFDTSVAPENRPPRCSSEGSKAGRRRPKASYHHGPWHSEGNDIPAASDRHMIKQVSMESNIERHISESVRRNMMRQAREDRMSLVKTGLACCSPMVGAQPGLERTESNLDSRLDKRRVAGVVKDTAMLRGTLKTLTFFEDFDDDSMVELIEAMELYEFEDGDKVVRQGDRDGSHFFVVAEGEFVITKDGKVVTVIGEGKSFGESVLLLFGERSATVCARGTARAYGMEGMAVREILRAQYEQKRRCVIQAVDEVLSSGACEMLSGLNAYQLQSLYDYVQMRSFDTGNVLLQEGVVEAKEVMVLFSGLVSVNSKGVTLEPMSRFGIAGDRQILFQEQPNTLVAEGPVQVLALSHALLESIFASQLSHVLVRNQILAALTQHQVFSRLHEEQLEDVAGCCQIEELAPGEDVLLEDVRFIALLRGDVKSSLDGDDENPEFHHCYGDECEILGEVNLLRRERPWAIRLCALEHSSSVKLAVWHSQDLDSILTFDNLDFALEHENKVRILKSAFIFQTLSKQQLQRLARALQTELVGVGERVFSQGDEGEHFYIIRKGLVSVEIDGRRIRTLGMGDYFGERAMLGNEQRSADIRAEEETELWKMEKATFQEIMQGPCLEYLTARISLQDTKLTFQDLDFVRVVGRGGYGVVKMVRARHTGMRYALKCVRKREVVERRQQEAIVSERSILAEVDHPFMVKFVRSFRTETRVYFLTELVSGGELLDALEQLGLLSHSQAMFYTGSILLALEFLHARRIAYLDLKSDNCLIDQQGYLKLIDFGMAKRINTARYTDMLGTPIFMAPEMILGKGYTTTADLWSLGICLYDFVIGEFPFADQSMDFGRIFDEVLRGELQFPDRFLCEHRAEEIVSMIRGLLTRDPSKRLGAGFEGYITLKEHAFFRGFNWDLLLGRELTPPFLPTRETYAEDKERRPTLAASENLPRLEEEEAAVDPRDEGWADPNPGWDIDF